MRRRGAGLWRGGLGALALALVALISLALPASAQDGVRTRSMEVSTDKGGWHLSFDASDFADHELREKLRNGLPQVLVVQVGVYTERGRKPLASTAQTCRVVYDLWDGGYRVQLDAPASSRAFTLRSAKAVVDACLNLKELELAGPRLRDAMGARVYCAVLVEFNPMSQATVERIRRWLSRSPSGQLRGDAFFGSFVSIFVSRKLGDAERSAAYRSHLWAAQ